MSLHEVASGERLHIGFFGMRNAGKSSIVNAVTGQKLSVVSDVKGTTTDPVKKTMELLPLGPVVIIDTPGLDDEGELGLLRVEKAKQILEEIHIAVLVLDAQKGWSEQDKMLVRQLQERKISFVTVFNKADLLKERQTLGDKALYVSAVTGEGVEELKNRLGAFAKNRGEDRWVVKDLVNEGDMVVLVIPIDEAAPKGRLIMPQQMTIRELLDAHAVAITCQDTDLKRTLAEQNIPVRL